MKHGALVFGLILLALSMTACSGQSLQVKRSSVTVTAGRSTEPLPSTIPLPSGRAVLVQEYQGTLNTRSATIWFYTIASVSETPALIVDFYKTAMPNNSWSVVAVPPETAQGKYGGTALAYSQNGMLTTIAAGIDPNYPRAVALLITVTQ